MYWCHYSYYYYYCFCCCYFNFRKWMEKFQIPLSPCSFTCCWLNVQSLNYQRVFASLLVVWFSPSFFASLLFLNLFFFFCFTYSVICSLFKQAIVNGLYSLTHSNNQFSYSVLILTIDGMKLCLIKNTKKLLQMKI